MLQYITYVLADYVKENDKRHEEESKAGHTKLKHSTAKDFKLPPVLPIVFYDGKTKWRSSLNLIDRTELSDIFYKYIPKFEYELVDLNKYSRDDLVNLGNLLSLILIVDKVREEDDLELLNTLPNDYLDKLKLNVPDHLLKLMADCMKLFLIKAEIEDEKIEAITEKLYQRRFVDMFDVQFSFKEIEKRVARESTRKAAIEIAKKLLQKGLSVADISESTGLDEELIEQLKFDVSKNVVLA